MVMVMELVRNQSFTFTNGDGNHYRLCRLKNDVPQEAVSALPLFNLSCMGTSALQNLQKEYQCKQSSIVALLWKLKVF